MNLKKGKIHVYRTTVSEESNGRKKHGKGYLWGAIVHDITLGSEKNKIEKYKRVGRYGGVSTANSLEFFVSGMGSELHWPWGQVVPGVLWKLE